MFKADLSGVITVSLQNAGPIGNLGAPVTVILPAGDYQVRTDGLILFSIGGNEVSADFSDVIFPEMAQFVMHCGISTEIILRMQSIGNARVSFYPEGGDSGKNQLPSC